MRVCECLCVVLRSSRFLFWRIKPKHNNFKKKVKISFCFHVEKKNDSIKNAGSVVILIKIRTSTFCFSEISSGKSNLKIREICFFFFKYWKQSHRHRHWTRQVKKFFCESSKKNVVCWKSFGLIVPTLPPFYQIFWSMMINW